MGTDGMSDQLSETAVDGTVGRGIPESLPTNDGSSIPSHIVTLVHGTFAPDAPWTAAGSELRMAIQNALTADGYRTIQFHVFRWSGERLRWFNNSHRHRLSAGKRLREELCALVERYPQARHVIVTHSHGGNVALYALKDDPALADRINGIACLATPFLTCHPRDLDQLVLPLVEMARQFGWISYLVLFVIVVGNLMHLLAWITTLLSPNIALTASPLLHDVGRYLYFGAWLGGAFVVPKLVARWLENNALPWFRTKQQHLLGIHDLPQSLLNLLAPKLFCAHVQGDEARLALGSVRGFERLSVTMLRKVAVFMVSLGIAACVVSALVGMIYTHHIGAVFLFGFLPFWMLLATFVPLYLLSLVTLRFILFPLRFAAFGGEIGLDGWLVDRHVVPVINGTAMERQYEPWKFPRTGFDIGFRHSNICNHPELVHELAEWVARTSEAASKDRK